MTPVRILELLCNTIYHCKQQIFYITTRKCQSRITVFVTFCQELL